MYNKSKTTQGQNSLS